MKMKRFGLVILTVLILLAAGMTFGGFAGAEENGFVWVETERFYLKDTTGNGYGIKIHKPNGININEVALRVYRQE